MSPLSSVLNFSAKSFFSLKLNSAPLSLNSLCGGPWTLIQQWVKCFTISLGFLAVTILAALKLVKWSMTWRYHTPGSNSCKQLSHCMLEPWVNLQYSRLWHVSHLLTVSLSISWHSSSSPAQSSNLFSFSMKECKIVCAILTESSGFLFCHIFSHSQNFLIILNVNLCWFMVCSYMAWKGWLKFHWLLKRCLCPDQCLRRHLLFSVFCFAQKVRECLLAQLPLLYWNYLDQSQPESSTLCRMNNSAITKSECFGAVFG